MMTPGSLGLVQSIPPTVALSNKYASFGAPAAGGPESSPFLNVYLGPFASVNGVPMWPFDVWGNVTSTVVDCPLASIPFTQTIVSPTLSSGGILANPPAELSCWHEWSCFMAITTCVLIANVRTFA